jgi:hypothetical protein
MGGQAIPGVERVLNRQQSSVMTGREGGVWRICCLLRKARNWGRRGGNDRLGKRRRCIIGSRGLHHVLYRVFAAAEPVDEHADAVSSVPFEADV